MSERSASTSGIRELLQWPDVPPMFAFDDRDGNRFYIAEEAA